MSKLGVTPWDIVRVVPFEEGGLVDASTALNSDGTIENFVDEAGAFLAARFMKNTAGQKDFIREYLPSLYTGGMRKLMQVSHLRGESGLSSARHDLFLPNWSDTYGIFVSSPVDGFCARWVIRICSSGIYRYPIRFSQPLPDNWQADEAAALSMTAEEAAQVVGRRWSAGNFDPSQGVQIGDIPLLYSDGNGGMYSTCGWAFNSDGTSAVNIGVRTDPDDPIQARRRATLYRINIAEGVGASAGIPMSAACIEVEHGELTNHFNDTDQSQGPAIIQVADSLVGGRGFCRTYSCWPGLIGPRLFSTNTPVFAYFDETDDLHVVRFTPDWSTDITTTTVNRSDVVGSTIVSSDTSDGDLSRSIEIYGSIVASDYPAGILGSAWGTTTESRFFTMRFTSPAVSPVARSVMNAKVETMLQSYGSSATVTDGTYPMVLAAIEWSVTQTHLTSGETSTFKKIREAAGDPAGQLRMNISGTIEKTRDFDERDFRHQVLILHGYDRTSYAVYKRRDYRNTNVNVTYGGSSIAIPDTSTLQYNGAISGFSWVDHKITSYDREYDTASHHIIETCVGVSKYPSGLLLTRSDAGDSVSPPASHGEEDSIVFSYEGVTVIGSTAYPITFDSAAVESVYLDYNFFYKAGGSCRSDRGFYQEKENITPANVFGVGSYGETSGNVTAFVGWF